MNLDDWLTKQGFSELAEGLQVHFGSVEELKGVTLKTILALGGTEVQHRRLVAAVAEYFDAVRAARAQAEGTLIERLPLFVAHTYAEYSREQDSPRLKLHWLCDVAELIARWTAAVLLATTREASGGELPEALSAKLRALIHRPSFGQWIDILRAATEAVPRPAAGPANRFAEWARGAGRSKRLAKRLAPIVTERNHLSHAGGGSMNHCREVLARLEPTLNDLVAELASAFDGLALVGLFEGRCHSLRGRAMRPTGEDRRERPCGDGVWLEDAETSLRLWPLLRHEKTESAKARGGPDGEPVPQCYLSVGGSSLTFVPIGADEPCCRVHDPEFRRLFTLDRIAETESAADTYIRIAHDEADRIVGRETERKAIHAWIEARTGGASAGAAIGLVLGGPGMGKSLLIARIVADLDTQESESRAPRFYFHRFRSGNLGNHRAEFVDGLLETLQRAGWCDRDEKQGTLAAEDRLRRVLNRPGGDGCPVFLVVIDGLDEIAKADAEFPDLLFELALPGTAWLVASRPEGTIMGRLSDPRIVRVIDPELPPLSKDDIRAMLERLPPAIKYKLLKRDEDRDGESMPPENPFVNAVAERAEGNPLYVHFLVADLEDERLDVNSERLLPQGLVRYYNKVLDGMGATYVAHIMPLVVALIACAEEPMSRGALVALSGDATDSALSDINKAIDMASAMLKLAATREREEGFTLYHTHFREHVLSDVNPLAKVVAIARDEFVNIFATPSSIPPALIPYASRCGVDHLLASDRVAAAVDLVTYFEAHHKHLMGDEHRHGLAKRITLRIGALLAQGDGPNVPAFAWEAEIDIDKLMQLMRLMVEFYEVEPLYHGIRLVHRRCYGSPKWDDVLVKLVGYDDMIIRHQLGRVLAWHYLATGEIGDYAAMRNLIDNVDEDVREVGYYGLRFTYVEKPEQIEAAVIGKLTSGGVYEHEILTELLLALVMHKRLGTKRLVDLVAGSCSNFWSPVWPSSRLFVAEIRAMEAFMKQEEATPDFASALSLIREADALRKALLDDGTLADRPSIRKLLEDYYSKPDPEQVRAAVPELRRCGQLRNIMVVLMSHPIWEIREATGTVLATLAASDPEAQALIREFAQRKGKWNWKVKYGASEARL